MAEANAVLSPSHLSAALARRALHARLERLRECELSIADPWGVSRFGSGGTLHVEIRVADPAFYSDVALGGTVGAGESYIAGRWTCSDLAGLVRILLRNR